MRLSVEGDQETVPAVVKLCMGTKPFNVTGAGLGFTFNVRPSQFQFTRLLLITNFSPGSVRNVRESSLIDLTAIGVARTFRLGGQTFFRPNLR